MQNETLLLSNCKLYALRLKGPTSYLWGHVDDDDNREWVDEAIWATGLICAFFGYGLHELTALL